LNNTYFINKRLKISVVSFPFLIVNKQKVTNEFSKILSQKKTPAVGQAFF